MIRYVNKDIVFQEVPGEVSLALNISSCPYHCDGCHSPYLREDIGEDLERDLPALLDRYGAGITCVLFLGEGKDFGALIRCIDLVSKRHLKTAVYTGMDIPPDIKDEDVTFYAAMLALPDYVKFGSYQKELGGLASPTTNQRMYKYNPNTERYENITHLFWRKPE